MLTMVQHKTAHINLIGLRLSGIEPGRAGTVPAAADSVPALDRNISSDGATWYFFAKGKLHGRFWKVTRLGECSLQFLELMTRDWRGVVSIIDNSAR